jgi:hypothetical protein
MKAPAKPPLTKTETPQEQLTILSNIPRWLYNSWQNAYNVADGERILEALASEEDENRLLDLYRGIINQVHDVPGADPNRRTCVIFGAGPSAMQYEKELDWIFKHCYTIASPTVLPWLSGQCGYYPDVVVNGDPHPILAQYAVSSGAHEHSLLICPPETSPLLPIAFQRHKTFWYRLAIPGPENDFNWEPYSVFANLLYGTIVTRIAQQGCTGNVAISLALALREFAGWNWDQILLIGFDYGFWKGLQRLPVDGGDPKPYEGTPDARRESDIVMLKDENGDDLATNQQMVRYKAAAMFGWMDQGLKVWTWSHGSLREFPRPTRDQVRNNDFPPYLAEMEIKKRATNFLAWYQRWQNERNAEIARRAREKWTPQQCREIRAGLEAEIKNQRRRLQQLEKQLAEVPEKKIMAPSAGEIRDLGKQRNG